MIILYGLFTCLLIFKVVCLSKLFVKASSHFGVENVCVCVYVYGRGECEFLSLFFFFTFTDVYHFNFLQTWSVPELDIISSIKEGRAGSDLLYRTSETRNTIVFEDKMHLTFVKMKTKGRPDTWNPE